MCVEGHWNLVKIPATVFSLCVTVTITECHINASSDQNCTHILPSLVRVNVHVNAMSQSSLVC